jgi:hypothetical protein
MTADVMVRVDQTIFVDDPERKFVAGKSPRGVMHQVLYRYGRLWHDPHPSRDGILDVAEVLAFRPLTSFDHEPSQQLAVAP